MIRGAREAVALPAPALELRAFEPCERAQRLSPWLDQNAGQVREELRVHGAALLRGFAPLDAAALGEAVERISGAALAYRERSTPRRQVGDQVYTSTEYPAQQEIFLHNENAYASVWPEHVYFYCARIDCAGGETPIAGNAAIAERIDPRVRQELSARGLLHRRTFLPGVGLAAEEVFQPPDGQTLEQHLAGSGHDLHRGADGRLVVEYRHGATVRHPHSGEECWFNHAAFFQPEGIDPATRAALSHLYGEDAFPNLILYGDGTRIPPEVVAHLRAAYVGCEQVRRWRAGDLLVLDNMRFAHGRRPFDGAREIWVAMARPCRREALAC